MNKSRTYLAYSMLIIYSLSFVRSSYESIHLIAHLPDLLTGQFEIHHSGEHENGNHSHIFIQFISDDNQSDEGLNADEYNPKMLEYSNMERAVFVDNNTLSLTIFAGIQINYKQQSISPPTQPPDNVQYNLA